MSEKETSIHPLVQLTLKNIDFDLSFELQQFEESQQKKVESLAVVESSPIPHDLPKQPIDYHYVSSPPPEEEDDNIPVASRIIPDKYSLKEIIFTPWAMFGLIIFIATNALVFINWDLNSSQTDMVENNNSLVEESTNNQTPENNLPVVSSGEETSTNSTPQEEVSFELPSPPDLPSPLPPNENGNNAQSNVNNQNEDNNLYPNLKTALLSEAVMYLAESNGENLSPVNMPQGDMVGGNSPQYHLITDYKSPEHFARVREKIPSAVVTNVNQEIKIQLGVFDNNSLAQQQAQQIQQTQQLAVNVIATR
ncbi:hypothetical protein IQ215_02990 [Cyanobacterium stanieri LEGE 03274]|uniref:SPOR domain-containing protein n=1 Tax=Cyanobacterium stanieri LEGE 03274 TaxID=1828756 RepID=A0ABR9V189_9CHRO|nr:hypothetical protein [Cyanobacterium stanieri]MBE9221653.1 hypothetical protein [Cyanobacterium stanieri LEGE 03274]